MSKRMIFALTLGLLALSPALAQSQDAGASRGDEGVPFESRSLSYKALNDIAEQISSEIGKTSRHVSRVLVLDENDNAEILSYKVFNSQAKVILARYESLLTAHELQASSLLTAPELRALNLKGTTKRGGAPDFVPLTVLETATSMAKSAAEFIALFRNETVTRSGSMGINPSALVALIADQLKQIDPQIKVINPHIYMPWSENDDPLGITNQLNTLYRYRAVTNTILTRYGADQAGRQTAAPIAEALKILNSLAEEYIKDRLKPDDNGVNSLAHVLRGEQMSNLLYDNKTRTSALYLRIVQAGGSERITKNLFLGTKHRFSGSAIVEYVLLDPDGTITASGTLYSDTGFTKIAPAKDSNRNNNFKKY